MRIRVPPLACLLGLWLAGPAGAASSLRFHGNGEGDIDRVKIALDDPFDADDEPGPPVDVGTGELTIEWWMKGFLAENAAPPVACGTNGDWIRGNIVLDRDRWQPGGRDWGVSLGAGRVVFGLENEASQAATFCGVTSVLDGDWHHVAVQRRAADGLVEIWVDGALEASGTGPTGDVSYPGDETPSGTNCNGGPCLASDPFLVIGAEKHDAGPEYPSFGGWIDELRVSTVRRYTAPFVRPSAPFPADPATAALYRFDEGEGDVVGDTSGAPGGPSNGVRRFGGSPAGPEWSPDTPFAASTEAAARLPEGDELRVEAFPNPALRETILWVRAGSARGGEVVVGIHDVAGRRVAAPRGTMRQGAAMIVWDGSAEDGTPLGPGVYFARVSGDAAGVAKIVLR